MSSILDGLKVNVYGNSIAAWDDPWGWVPRMRADHNWQLTWGAEWSSRAVDAVGQATAVASPHRIDHSRKPHVVIVDAVANDAYGLGAGNLPAFTTAVRSLATYALLEGVMNVVDCGFPAASWTFNQGEDFIAGRNVTAAAGTEHQLPGFNRAGKWAFFYYGLAGGNSGWQGGSWSLARDGVPLGTYSCHNRTHNPSTSDRMFGYGSGGQRVRRQWVLCSEVVDVPATAQFTVKAGPGGGNPYFAGYGKLNEAQGSTSRQSPLVVLVEPAYGYDAATNSVLDSYADALHQIAASLPNVVVARTRNGWDTDRMARVGDFLHPNAVGCRHYQDAIEAAVNGAHAGGWIPNTHLPV
ncbi:hypothetical protein [Actinosynnema mirum]|uniref:Uncharacterized protein n=1 Tax=Actinosynnema mirum (strain ATCC 29888 / DSM 43827 / JCM 3225 / NBRC 14064 / NCIMB 13271 / NRRL B-12336 / IMRU 3971 / 101) TaxID=446462 RepID=C6WC72_ACTMD|nr:hypothetical protein [Actinosynnema mirum]ACU39460.1 hypothetical protein Amir_5644 [Actinosynnema mirum DSM 43827]